MTWTALGCFNLFITPSSGMAIWATMHQCGVIFVRFTKVLVPRGSSLVILAVRITVGVSIAIPAASLCINRRLCRISCLQIFKTTDVEVSFTTEHEIQVI
jgi:hypothetical protein